MYASRAAGAILLLHISMHCQFVTCILPYFLCYIIGGWRLHNDAKASALLCAEEMMVRVRPLINRNTNRLSSNSTQERQATMHVLGTWHLTGPYIELLYGM
jgi:hypothetical protein